MPEITDEDGCSMSSDKSTAGSSGGEELSPNLFKKYELGRLLGCGAFAKVYHARVIRTGQSVAIKALSKQRIQMGKLAGNIKREISIMRRPTKTKVSHQISELTGEKKRDGTGEKAEIK